MTTGRRALRVQIPGRSVRRCGNRPRRHQPTSPSSQPLSRLAASPGTAFDTTLLHRNTQSLNDSTQLLEESITHVPESPVESSSLEVPNHSIQLLRELEACLTVARRVLVDGNPLEIQSSTAFVADVLRAVLGMIEECEHAF
jgi:hypothetical protein